MVELAFGGFSVELAASDQAVELGQDLGADQGWRQQLVLRRYLGLRLGQVQGDIGANHEPCHCVALGGEFVAWSSAATLLPVPTRPGWSYISSNGDRTPARWSGCLSSTTSQSVGPF
jgi:hypothetical protein